MERFTCCRKVCSVLGFLRKGAKPRRRKDKDMVVVTIPPGPRGSSSPDSSVLPRHCDFLPFLPPHFVAFAWRYHGSARPFSFLPTPPRAKRRAWGWSPGIPARACFRGNDRISQVSGEPQFPSAHVLGPRTASTPQTITERSRGPPPQKREGAVVQQNFEAGYSMAFGSPPTYHKYRLPSTGKAGFQVLVRLSCTGFPPAGVLQKVSNSRHVCFPPFPGFLTQFAPLRLCGFAPLRKSP